MSDILTELFSSRVRSAVLEWMLPRPHLGYSLTDLSRLLELPVSSLQHECYKLERIGILRARRDGTSRVYRVNPASPVRRELTALIVAAIGQEAAARAALDQVAGLEAAFIGRELPLESSPANGKAPNPIPLVLIGEIPLEEIDAAQERVASVLGIPSNGLEAVFYRPADWLNRLEQRSAYAVWLISGPRTELIGPIPIPDPLNPEPGDRA
jgi:hypothetical protein